MSEKLRLTFTVEEALKERERLEEVKGKGLLSQRETQLLSILNQWLSHYDSAHSAHA